MAGAYERFLASGDATVWTDCLLECEQRLLAVAGDAAAAGELLAQALLISIYARWLGSESGALAQRKTVRASCARLLPQLRDLHRRAPSPATRRAWGEVLAARGERAAALRLLGDAAFQVAEMVPVLMPADHAERATLLRPHVAGPAQRPFAPVVFCYCHALIALGAVRHARAALDASAMRQSDPLAIDLLGKIHESAGSWTQAAQVYAGSTWPIHQYRARMCDAIVRGAGGEASALDAGAVRNDEEFDGAMQEAIGRFEGDIGQIELARNAAFVNAWLWNPVPDWRVHLELGKLSFRRRRHSEAAAHLGRALAQAPEPARMMIAELRFSTLTWLDGSTAGAELHMQPEAIEAAYAVIRAGGADPETASARVWVADRGDPSVLPAQLDDWHVYWQARAHRSIGNEPEALAAALACLCESYTHRNLIELITTFHLAGFEQTVDGLVQIVEAESADDFSALLELTECLTALHRQFGEGTPRFQALGDRLQALAERLLDLSQTDFQHLIRAQELFARSNRQDLAETLLRRAAMLAEGCSENLAVAVARRRSPWFDSGSGDELALERLRRAEREARERLERAQIARELFHNGRAQRARQLLESDKLLVDGEPVEPIEAVVALQCWPWLGADGLNAQIARSTSAVTKAEAAGTILHGTDRFLRRVRKTLGLDADAEAVAEEGDDGARAAAAGAAGAAAASLERSAFAQWRGRIDTAISVDGGEPERQLFAEGVATFGAAAAFEPHFALVAFAVQRMEQALVEARRVQPMRGPGTTPIRYNVTLDNDQRAVELADRWRALLRTAAGPERERARRDLEQFQRDEEELTTQWEQAQRAEAEPLLRIALHYAQWLSSWLPALRRDAEQTEPDPSLSPLFERVVADAGALAHRAAAQAQAIEIRLEAAQPQVLPP